MRFHPLLAAAVLGLPLAGCEDKPLGLDRAAATQDIQRTCRQRVAQVQGRFSQIQPAAVCACVVERMLGRMADGRVRQLSRAAFDISAQSAYPDCSPEAFPPPEPGDAAAQAARAEEAAIRRYRAIGIETCLANLGEGAGIAAAEAPRFCACTLDAYVADKRSSQLAPLTTVDALNRVLGTHALQCQGGGPDAAGTPTTSAPTTGTDPILQEAERAMEEARRAADQAQRDAENAFAGLPPVGKPPLADDGKDPR